MATKARADKPDGLLQEPLDAFGVWLDKQPLSGRSRAAYRSQVAGFLAWLATTEDPMAALSATAVRDWAARDYKRFLKTKQRLSPASVNQALAAIDSFYRSGVGVSNGRNRAVSDS